MELPKQASPRLGLPEPIVLRLGFEAQGVVGVGPHAQVDWVLRHPTRPRARLCPAPAVPSCPSVGQ
eukprot:13127090-Alexandrium_andersonii.AAC.1